MEGLTILSVALAQGMWEVGKRLLESVSDAALKPAKEQVEKNLLKKYKGAQQDKDLLDAIKSALEQAGGKSDGEDDFSGWLEKVGLDKLKAEKNHALRQTLARAVIGFADAAAAPPADLMTALAWPRSKADELAELLSAFRAAFAGLDGWKDLIAYADSAHQNGLLNAMLAALSKMENAFVQSEAGAYLRVAVVETGLTEEQAAHIEETYRDGIQSDYRKHYISGLSSQVQKVVALPLEDVYLELGLIPISSEAEREREMEEMLEMRDSHRMEREMRRMEQRVTNALAERSKLVIVGKPGSGKTISLKFVSLMLAYGSAGAARLGLDAPYIPVFVRLADYAEKLKADSALALETFLLDYINRSYPGAPRQDEFLRLALDKGACLILLDGLDEVGDFGDTLVHGNTLRVETLKKVQSFANRRCNDKSPNRIVVTSRLEGYRRGDLPDFQEMELSPLRLPDEVEAFLSRWFTAWLQETDGKLTFETAQKRAQRDYVNGVMHSINQSESVRRLAINPLLLTILAIIYQIGRNLPNRRVELYEIVAKTMIENWRHSQTGHTSRIHERMSANEVYFMLASLAYWLHENKPGGTMSQEEWQKKISALLKEAGHEDAELNQLVEHFMRHARNETGLLTERSPGQIGFFHLTLEEYMAAVEIARQDTDTRLSMLETHWQNPRWGEVILLTAGDLDQRGNKQFLESFLLHILHLEGGKPGSNALLTGRALADVGVRRVKESIAKDVRAALKFVMQDADPDTGKPYPAARIALEDRASAADTLDELGYIPEDLYEFAAVPGDLFFARHPVTNLQYQRFLNAPDFADERYWTDFPKYDENGVLMDETWGGAGLDWLKRALKDSDEADGKVIFPRNWLNPRFGIARRTAPVVSLTWWEANAYCKWLTVHYRELPEFASLSALRAPDVLFRLPLETEWTRAAGGEKNDRFAFGELKNPKDEIMQYANTSESGINRTTPVGMYPLGRTQSGLWDMGGNVWEWQANFYDKDHDVLALRGGSWDFDHDFARVSARYNNRPNPEWYLYGFRVCCAPPSKGL
jgi:formylglycine-generating enzyme required for sulfatase activity